MTMLPPNAGYKIRKHHCSLADGFGYEWAQFSIGLLRRYIQMLLLNRMRLSAGCNCSSYGLFYYLQFIAVAWA